VYPFVPWVNNVWKSGSFKEILFLTRYGKSGLDSDFNPKDTACAVPLLMSCFASSIETPSLAIIFPL